MTTAKKELSIFVADVDSAISEALEACLEAPEDGDWSPYDEFKTDLCEHIEKLARQLIASLPKQKEKSTKSSSSSGSGEVKNAYSAWVKKMSKIRKDELSGSELVTVGQYFKDKKSSTATKFHQATEDGDNPLCIEGDTMSIKELLNRLKEYFPNEKGLTLSAMSWGLVDPDVRRKIAIS